VQSDIDLQEQRGSELARRPSEAYRPWPQHGFSGEGELEELVQVTVAVVTAAAALIHFAVVQEHWKEYWPLGLFFAGAGSIQALCALFVLARPSRQVYGAIAVGSFALMALWWYSRMVGVPIGPHKGMLETARLTDVVCTEFEVVGLIGALLLMWPGLVRRQFRAWEVSLSSIAVAATVAWVTQAAMPLGGRH
jgi:hypothetical protein